MDKYLRSVLILSGTVYPLWSLFLYLAMPQEYDSAIGRVTIGVICWTVLLVGTRLRLYQKVAEAATFAAVYLMTVHFFYLCYRAQLSTIYITGGLVFTCAVSALFNHLRYHLGFSLLATTASIVVATTVDAPLNAKLMFSAGILTTVLVSGFVLSARLKLADAYRIQQDKSAALEKQVLVEQGKAAEAEKERLATQLQAASAVQTALLPEKTVVPGLTVDTFYRSAEQAGGDWYGWHVDADGDCAFFYIGDVTGHGVPSALVTGVLAGSVYTGSSITEQQSPRPSTLETLDHRLLVLATTINQVVTQTGSRSSRYVTMILLGMDIRTGQVRYVNAGHTPLVAVTGKNRDVSFKYSGGPILGFEPKPDFEVQGLDLQRGDGIFFYTDGLLENAGPKGDTLSRKDLRTMIAAGAGHADPLGDIKAKVDGLWREANLADDVTFFYVRYDGRA